MTKAMQKQFILQTVQAQISALIEAMDLGKLLGDKLFEGMSQDQLAFAEACQRQVVALIRDAPLVAAHGVIW